MNLKSAVLVLWLFLIHCISAQVTSTGFIPITELKTGTYKGFQGGLYPEGTNTKPWIHDSLGLAISKQFTPLNKDGFADTLNGKIVLLSIGMSNTTMEFSIFKVKADTFKQKNPRLVIVDGAQGGKTAAIISNPKDVFWDSITTLLQIRGVNANQVQACWLKEADSHPTLPFLDHANLLVKELTQVVQIIKQRYPNCRIVYLSSRIYGGYAKGPLNPEPYAYEGAFAVKWLIEKQIDHDTSLICTGNNPKAPYLEWGPYLWADGLNPRSDGLIWKLEDFDSGDGTHPSLSGRLKVAQLLLDFFSSNPTSKNWFLKNAVSGIQQSHSNFPTEFNLFQNYPNPFNPSTRVIFSTTREGIYSLNVYNILGQHIKTLANKVFSAGTHKLAFDAGNLPSGIYYYQLFGEGVSITRKMILAK